MRKFGIILFMIVMCVVYFFYARERSSTKDNGVVSVIQADKKFEDIKQNIEESYPSTPKEVIQTYNELMGYAYCSAMKDDYIDEYVADLSLLYSKELLELNPEEKRVALLTAERLANVENPLVVIESEIETVIKAENNGKISDTNAQVEVVHYTNKGDIARTYDLVKEDGKWKINSWTNNK